MAKLVKMDREYPDHKGGPVTANVHPDNVEEMKLFDWRVTETKKPKTKAIENEDYTDQTQLETNG